MPSAEHPVRPPAVAGTFYPAAAPQLTRTVEGLLSAAAVRTAPAPKALIVPHAGYIYSGPAQAAAYARLAAAGTLPERVVLLGPPHHVALAGIGLSGCAAFGSPLGQLRVDQAAVAAWRDDGHAELNDAAHEHEHALEVQLPFLHRVAANCMIVPALVGEIAARQLAALLETWWHDPRTLIVVSTDLSHFLDYEGARARDRDTDGAIMALADEAIGPQQACGYRALNGLLHLARTQQARIDRLALFNSADTAGSRERVVGYAAYALH